MSASPFASDFPSVPEGSPSRIEHGPAAQDASITGARARGEDALSAAPRIVTTGGKFSFPDDPSSESNHLAFVDYLAFTVSPRGKGAINWLSPYLLDLFAIPTLRPLNKGGYGYESLYDMSGFGVLAYGGESQRGTAYVGLTGQGCSRVRNWPAVWHFLEHYEATLTRVDVAHDDHDGTTLSIGKALRWYREGLFNSGGRKPSIEPRGDWLTPGSPKGRTLYIGRRQNGKFCRIYEKGKQYGSPISPWVRAEVEFKNENRVLPYDMLTRPGDYLAGAYPCMAYLSTIQEKIKTITKAANISYAASIQYARLMFGPLLNLMMELNDGDATKVVSELRRGGIPRRLQYFADSLPQTKAPIVE